MEGVKAQNRVVGPPRSPTRAPLVGVGADFKTTPSWGGPNGPLGPNASSASAAKRLVLPSGEVINVPDGFEVKVVRRFGVVYHVEDKGAAVRLVAELLYRIAKSNKGGVYYLNGRKLATVLNLNGRLNPFTASLIYGILSRLSFEVTRVARGVVAVIDMNKPIMREVKNAKSIDEVIKIVEKHLR
jgi:hypothetical protein